MVPKGLVGLSHGLKRITNPDLSGDGAQGNAEVSQAKGTSEAPQFQKGKNLSPISRGADPSATAADFQPNLDSSHLEACGADIVQDAMEEWEASRRDIPEADRLSRIPLVLKKIGC